MKTRCPLCGEKSYSHRIKNVTYAYKGIKKSIKQPGYWCNACDDGVVGGKDHIATMKLLQTFHAEVDGLLPPEAIRRIRKKLGLTQRQASGLFGGGVNAFSRYEKGEVAIYRATSQILRLLDNHPDLLCEISDFSGLVNV